MFRWRFPLLFLLLLCPPMAQAVTRYVAIGGIGGSNCTSGQNIGTPLSSIQNGLSCLAAGDTLYLRSGTYTESGLSINVAGTASQPIFLAGYPGEARPIFRSSSVNQQNS